ncbi:hypothetical protein BESB_009200 [Besnoitia besnoiti]|uniref:Uncharacterized protein n=1 Tax=Besnoitia besnoiti TaxID=94643 RepID=A0A2A9MJ59_BESBE|nr:hypothetical protein BESB_009200 [Besnoitia besnoiti]PFH38578.1 hypothetical protein BESB_009200 [Besnoitia besnoiti]
MARAEDGRTAEAGAGDLVAFLSIAGEEVLILLYRFLHEPPQACEQPSPLSSPPSTFSFSSPFFSSSNSTSSASDGSAPPAGCHAASASAVSSSPFCRFSSLCPLAPLSLASHSLRLLLAGESPALWSLTIPLPRLFLPPFSPAEAPAQGPPGDSSLNEFSSPFAHSDAVLQRAFGCSSPRSSSRLETRDSPAADSSPPSAMRDSADLSAAFALSFCSAFSCASAFRLAPLPPCADASRLCLRRETGRTYWSPQKCFSRDREQREAERVLRRGEEERSSLSMGHFVFFISERGADSPAFASRKRSDADRTSGDCRGQERAEDAYEPRNMFPSRAFFAFKETTSLEGSRGGACTPYALGCYFRSLEYAWRSLPQPNAAAFAQLPMSAGSCTPYASLSLFCNAALGDKETATRAEGESFLGGLHARHAGEETPAAEETCREVQPWLLNVHLLPSVSGSWLVVVFSGSPSHFLTPLATLWRLPHCLSSAPFALSASLCSSTRVSSDASFPRLPHACLPSSPLSSPRPAQPRPSCSSSPAFPSLGASSAACRPECVLSLSRCRRPASATKAEAWRESGASPELVALSLSAPRASDDGRAESEAAAAELRISLENGVTQAPCHDAALERSSLSPLLCRGETRLLLPEENKALLYRLPSLAAVAELPARCLVSVAAVDVFAPSVFSADSVRPCSVPPSFSRTSFSPSPRQPPASAPPSPPSPPPPLPSLSRSAALAAASAARLESLFFLLTCPEACGKSRGALCWWALRAFDATDGECVLLRVVEKVRSSASSARSSFSLPRLSSAPSTARLRRREMREAAASSDPAEERRCTERQGDSAEASADSWGLQRPDRHADSAKTAFAGARRLQRGDTEGERRRGRSGDGGGEGRREAQKREARARASSASPRGGRQIARVGVFAGAGMKARRHQRGREEGRKRDSAKGEGMGESEPTLRLAGSLPSAWLLWANARFIVAMQEHCWGTPLEEENESFEAEEARRRRRKSKSRERLRDAREMEIRRRRLYSVVFWPVLGAYRERGGEDGRRRCRCPQKEGFVSLQRGRGCPATCAHPTGSAAHSRIGGGRARARREESAARSGPEEEEEDAREEGEEEAGEGRLVLLVGRKRQRIAGRWGCAAGALVDTFLLWTPSESLELCVTELTRGLSERRTRPPRPLSGFASPCDAPPRQSPVSSARSVRSPRAKGSARRAFKAAAADWSTSCAALPALASDFGGFSAIACFPVAALAPAGGTSTQGVPCSRGEEGCSPQDNASNPDDAPSQPIPSLSEGSSSEPAESDILSFASCISSSLLSSCSSSLDSSWDCSPRGSIASRASLESDSSPPASRAQRRRAPDWPVSLALSRSPESPSGASLTCSLSRGRPGSRRSYLVAAGCSTGGLLLALLHRSSPRSTLRRGPLQASHTSLGRCGDMGRREEDSAREASSASEKWALDVLWSLGGAMPPPVCSLALRRARRQQRDAKEASQASCSDESLQRCAALAGDDGPDAGFANIARRRTEALRKARQPGAWQGDDSEKNERRDAAPGDHKPRQNFEERRDSREKRDHHHPTPVAAALAGGGGKLIFISKTQTHEAERTSGELKLLLQGLDVSPQAFSAARACAAFPAPSPASRASSCLFFSESDASRAPSSSSGEAANRRSVSARGNQLERGSQGRARAGVHTPDSSEGVRWWRSCRGCRSAHGSLTELESGDSFWWVCSAVAARTACSCDSACAVFFYKRRVFEKSIDAADFEEYVCLLGTPAQKQGCARTSDTL